MINLLLATLITVSNPSSSDRTAVPVVIPVEEQATSALVTLGGKEVPCQLDDLNDDGIYDELAFVTDIKARETQKFSVTFSNDAPRQYPAKAYASMSIRDRDSKAKTPKHLPATSITVPASSDAFQYIFPHGPVMESELVGFRVYSDHRQAIDYYGHKSLTMDIAKTDFYPTKEQVRNGSGDDVLYTGTTYGCGALMGWDGKNAVMFQKVRNTTYAVAANGPVRAIIDITNKGWQPYDDTAPVDIRTRYILYAGHRDVEVQVQFSRPISGMPLSTGIVDIVEGSEELTDKAGLRGCWGTACAGNNPQVYDTHTVGLGICIPQQYYKSDSHFTDGKDHLPNQAYVQVVGTDSDQLRYWFTATCDLEEYSYDGSENGKASKDSWFKYLKTWKKQLLNPVNIIISPKN